MSNEKPAWLRGPEAWESEQDAPASTPRRVAERPRDSQQATRPAPQRAAARPVPLPANWMLGGVLLAALGGVCVALAQEFNETWILLAAPLLIAGGLSFQFGVIAQGVSLGIRHARGLE